MKRLSLFFAAAAFIAVISINPAYSQNKGKVNPVATVETSMGTFQIELYQSDAPKTVENFIGLAEKKYFDGIRVHRIVPNFVIQTGDPNSRDTKLRRAWGSGGNSIWGGPFADELNQKTESYKKGYMKGVVAMANAGPNTNTSQFFVMLKDNSTLPKNYTIFGKVIKGMDVVDKIGQVSTDASTQQPKTDVWINKVTVSKPGGKK